MGESPFITRRVLKGNQVPSLVFHRHTNRCLGGFGCTYYRAYVYPLYTPAGQPVIQEAPCDHPFQTGMVFAQGPVVVGQREANFWIMPPPRRASDPLWDHVGRMDCHEPPEIALHECGARFELRITWRDDHEEPMLDETRTVDMYSVPDATICDMTTRVVASCGAVEMPQTKHGGLGIRVEPRLLPFAGGVIVADGGRRGAAEVVHGGESDFIAYENDVTGPGPHGVLLSVLENGIRGPWFVRDYGLVLYCPTLHESVSIPSGEAWSAGIRVVAYDGQLTEERARAWLDM